jgi:hypothetical protein
MGMDEGPLLSRAASTTPTRGYFSYECENTGLISARVRTRGTETKGVSESRVVKSEENVGKSGGLWLSASKYRS